MSTYFFKTNLDNPGIVTQVKPHLDKLETDKDIDRWHLNMNNHEGLLEIETQKLTPEEVKHILRALGIEADFTKAPQAR